MISLIFIYQYSIAQVSSFQIKDNEAAGQTVIDGQTFYHNTRNSGPTVNHEFEIKNTSANTLTLSLRKYEDLINTVNAANNDVAQAYFCFGTNCLPSNVMSYSVELNASESILLEAKFDEASIAGHSIVRYKFNNKTNTSDALIVTLKYDTNVGILNNQDQDHVFSEVYPNPSQHFLHIDYKNQIQPIKEIKWMNASGQFLDQTFQTTLNEKGITINYPDLSAGIYFIQIKTDKIISTKKVFIIN